MTTPNVTTDERAEMSALTAQMEALVDGLVVDRDETEAERAKVVERERSLGSQLDTAGLQIGTLRANNTVLRRAVDEIEQILTNAGIERGTIANGVAALADQLDAWKKSARASEQLIGRVKRREVAWDGGRWVEPPSAQPTDTPTSAELAIGAAAESVLRAAGINPASLVDGIATLIAERDTARAQAKVAHENLWAVLETGAVTWDGVAWVRTDDGCQSDPCMLPAGHEGDCRP